MTALVTPRCFVIGPIGDAFAPIGSPGREKYEQALEVYEHVIVAACTQFGISPIRADHISAPGEITEQIFRHLYEDEVVIADVSDGNPNVMYELGLRHTRDLLTIQLGEYGQLPFDIRAIRTIEFSRSERGLIEARKKLVAALTAGLAQDSDPVTATKVWLAAAAGLGRIVVDEDNESNVADIEEIEPDGFVELIASVEVTFIKLTASAEQISSHMVAMGSEAEAAGRDFGLLSEQQAPMADRLAALAKYADQLTEHANALEPTSAEFAKDMDSINQNVYGILDFLGEHPEAWSEDTEDFLAEIESLAATSRDSMESISHLAGTVKGLGQYSKALRKPSRRIFDSVNLMADKVRLMDEWESAVARLRRRHNAVDTATVDNASS